MRLDVCVAVLYEGLPCALLLLLCTGHLWLEEGMVFTNSLGCCDVDRVVMILPQVHLRKPCYDFTFL